MTKRIKKLYTKRYPDEPAGYKCYSIQLWEVELPSVFDWALMYVYIIETRFIWAGRLLEHSLEVHEHGEKELLERLKLLDEKWKLKINEMIKEQTND